MDIHYYVCHPHKQVTRKRKYRGVIFEALNENGRYVSVLYHHIIRQHYQTKLIKEPRK